MISNRIPQTRLFFFILALGICHLSLCAQKLTVESMKLLADDAAAMTFANQRQDLNGNYAGIVKVQLAVDGAKFEGGGVLEQTKYEAGEYWVWMAKDSKRIKVYAPGYLPLELNFHELFGILIESKRTYSLVLAKASGTQPSNDNCYLPMKVFPTTAEVKIDGVIQELKNGETIALVKKGRHEYMVSAGGFVTKKGYVVVSPNMAPLEISLESLRSNVQVKCATTGAQIFVNGQLRGVSPQTLSLLSGTYRLEARLDGYHSYVEDIRVSDNENRMVSIPELQRLSGTLMVSYMPIGSDVMIDGYKMGVTPGTFSNVSVGSHKVEIRKDGYATANMSVEVKDNESTELSGSLMEVSTPVQHNQSSLGNSATVQESPGSSIETFTVNGVSFRMIRVEGGSFQMGATEEQGSDADDYEKPVHLVTLSDFKIGETEVTQALWEAVMGNNPSRISGDLNRPVDTVGTNEIRVFLNKLNDLTGKSFRLPTEAEWEYAARGGNKSKGFKYSGSNDLDEVAWYSGNSDSNRFYNEEGHEYVNHKYGSHPVALKKPNELGLYDMSGNVYEECQGKSDKYKKKPQTNPTGYSKKALFPVVRGGSWNYESSRCRVSSRKLAYEPETNGFRLAL